MDFAAVQMQADDAYAAGDWRNAETHYLALVRANAQDPKYWFRLGNIYARTQRADAAVSAYREAAARDADNGKVWFNMGTVQLRQAADSFERMKSVSDYRDPMAAQGAAAYAAIMEILDKPQATIPAVVAPDPPPGSHASPQSGERDGHEVFPESMTTRPDGGALLVSPPSLEE